MSTQQPKRGFFGRFHERNAQKLLAQQKYWAIEVGRFVFRHHKIPFNFFLSPGSNDSCVQPIA